MTSTAPGRISRLRVPTDAEITDDRLRRRLDQLESERGFVPNWQRAIALSPTYVRQFDRYLDARLTAAPNSKSTLTTRERLIVATAVAGSLRDAYTHHEYAAALDRHTGEHALGQGVAVDYRHARGISDRERLLAELAVRTDRDPHAVDDAFLAEVSAAGVDTPEAYEAIAIAVLIGAKARIATALAIPPNREDIGVPATSGAHGFDQAD
jgi:uncharacterized peroxidase-related enzyme